MHYWASAPHKQGMSESTAGQTDVLMLNAQNLNKFRFQIKYFVCNENVLSKE